MKIKVIVIILFSVVVLSFAPSAFAANVQGSVENGGIPTAGSSVRFTDSTHTVVVTQTVDSTGKYFVNIPQGTYDVTVVPPAESGLEQKTEQNVKIETPFATVNPIILTASKNAKTLTPMNKGDLQIKIILGIMVALLGLGLGYVIVKVKF